MRKEKEKYLHHTRTPLHMYEGKMSNISRVSLKRKVLFRILDFLKYCQDEIFLEMYEIPSTYSYSPPYAPSSNSPPSSAHS